MEEENESPYCELCGHCGVIGCCGIEGFINEHIKGKTNCKNEDWIVAELIHLCEYETDIFKQNTQLEKDNKELHEENDKLKARLMLALEFVNSLKCVVDVNCISYLTRDSNKQFERDDIND